MIKTMLLTCSILALAGCADSYYIGKIEKVRPVYGEKGVNEILINGSWSRIRANIFAGEGVYRSGFSGGIYFKEAK